MLINYFVIFVAFILHMRYQEIATGFYQHTSLARVRNNMGHIRIDVEDCLALVLLLLIRFVIASHHLPVLKYFSRPKIILNVLVIKSCNEEALALERLLITNYPVSDQR